MSFKATATYRCDGCKVCETEAVELQAEMLRPVPPKGWLRVETTELLQNDLDVHAVKHYCQLCKPLISSYLAGRREAPGHAD